MTDTVISSATKEVVIGFERPFVVIGERINPTGRKLLAAEMAVGDYSRVSADALAQVEAGAAMLDVNAGIPLADEPRILAEAIKLVQSITDVPLSIDSSIVAALESERHRAVSAQAPHAVDFDTQQGERGAQCETARSRRLAAEDQLVHFQPVLKTVAGGADADKVCWHPPAGR